MGVEYVDRSINYWGIGVLYATGEGLMSKCLFKVERVRPLADQDQITLSAVGLLLLKQLAGLESSVPETTGSTGLRTLS